MQSSCLFYLVLIIFIALLSYAASGLLGLIGFIIMLLIPFIWEHYNGPQKK